MKRNRADRREQRDTVRAAVETAFALGGAVGAARMVTGLRRHTRCPSCTGGRKRSAASGDRVCTVCNGAGVFTTHRARELLVAVTSGVLLVGGTNTNVGEDTQGVGVTSWDEDDV